MIISHHIICSLRLADTVRQAPKKGRPYLRKQGQEKLGATPLTEPREILGRATGEGRGPMGGLGSAP